MHPSPIPSQRPRHLTLVSRARTGQPGTYRLDGGRSPARAVAYRKLAVAILGVDIETLTAQLRHQRSCHEQ